MWFIPLLVIGAIVVAAASKSPRELVPPSRQLPPPGPPTVAGLPGPISVLGAILRIGQVPSPTVILCAIAEAEAIGRDDLASDIVRVFVAPVVHAQQRGGGACFDHLAYARGSCALPRSPRAQAERGTRSQPSAPFDLPRGSCARAGSPREEASREDVPAVPQMAARSATAEEILAMLHVDPQTFLAMVSSGRPPMIEVPIEPIETPRAISPEPPLPPQVGALSMPAAPAEPLPTGLSSEAVAQMQEAAGLHEAADQTRALAPGSPLGGVPDGAWREFVVRLERESPMFTSSRHVGQYRHRRERLAELGIDPSALHGSAAAQRTALDADLADAHAHAAAGGLLDHLGRTIAVPGHEGPAAISLSGLLGVIQCAGLEGAVGWLEKPNDRKRYPHTTQVFLRTNGVF